LEKNNVVLRAEVATELMTKSTSYVNTNLVAPDYERIVRVTLPTETKAAILHARYIKERGHTCGNILYWLMTDMIE
jgi:hypothetical protein